MNQDWLPIKAYGGYQKRAGTAPQAVAQSHPLIVGDSGTWSLDCGCGAF